MSNKTVTQTQQQPKTETPGRKPIHEFRLGKVKAAVWQNSTDNGIRYNVTVGRLYKEGQEWKQTESFGRDDLPSLAAIINDAWRWIYQKQQEHD